MTMDSLSEKIRTNSLWGTSIDQRVKALIVILLSEWSPVNPAGAPFSLDFLLVIQRGNKEWQIVESSREIVEGMTLS